MSNSDLTENEESKDPFQQLLDTGIARAASSLIVFILCVIHLVLAVYITTGLDVVITILAVYKPIHFLVTMGFICAGMNGDPRPIRLWFIVEMTLSFIFIVFLIVGMCLLPSEQKSVGLILGIKFVIITIGLSCRFADKYFAFQKQPIRMQPLHNEESA